MAWAAIVVAAIGVMQSMQQAQQASENAKLAKTEGDIANNQAIAQANQVQRQAENLTSSQLANAAHGGVVPVSGSPIEVMIESAKEAELRRQDELYGGKLAKYQSKLKAKGFSSQIPGIVLGGVGKVAGVVGSSYSRTSAPSATGNP